MVRTFCAILLGFLLTLATYAYATLPASVTVSFDAPTTGSAPDGYNVYLDDCDPTGSVGPPIGTLTTGTNGTFTDVITAEGTYVVCVRAYNAAGEQPDPGSGGRGTLTVTDVLLPGPVENIDVTCSVSVGAVVCTFTAG